MIDTLSLYEAQLAASELTRAELAVFQGVVDQLQVIETGDTALYEQLSGRGWVKTFASTDDSGLTWTGAK